MVTFLVDLWIIKSIMTALFHVPVTRNWALSFIHVRKSHIWFPLSNISKSLNTMSETIIGMPSLIADYILFRILELCPLICPKILLCFSWSGHIHVLFFWVFFIISSPGPKVQVNYCHHLASVVCRL